MGLQERLEAATAHLAGPLVVVDLDALEANADDLVRRAGGTPVRLATKSVRVRAIIDQVLARPGWAGVMAYSLAEALWLVEHGHEDVLVGYPTVDRGALAALVASPAARRAVTLMVDDEAQAALVARAQREHDARTGARAGGPDDATVASADDGLAAAAAAAAAAAEAVRAAARGGGREGGLAAAPPVRVCLDVDASWRPGVGRWRAHLGVRRSPVHTPAEAAALAERVAATGVDVVGLMFYEAQVAGLPDTSAAVRAVKRASVADLAVRRTRVLRAVEGALGRPLALVNSGGTGSLETSAADPTVTEVTAGSGLYVPGLFDGYRTVARRPAVFFGLDVVRTPARGIVTAFGGGYVASGPAGPSRTPRIALPAGARYVRSEGPGEVQTPLRLPRGTTARVGDRVWLRHAKAGELMERFARAHLVRGDAVVATVATYRGEGRAFG